MPTAYQQKMEYIRTYHFFLIFMPTVYQQKMESNLPCLRSLKFCTKAIQPAAKPKSQNSTINRTTDSLKGQANPPD